MHAIQPFRRESSACHVQIPADHGQHVVEVVCQAAGKLAYRFHLVRLTELFVHRLQFARALGHPQFERRIQDAKLLLRAPYIVDVGSHDQLMAERGFYHDLYMSQFRGDATPVDI